ncbi:MAG: TRAP transporter small permease subunit [Desulfohalobiaceae bacterium]|nr:TRAP transporter small permease subunit [Desulfohalobiaceae bacterium]
MKLADWIDRLSIGTGKAVSWIVPVLVLELVYDTAARYLFNAPTIWSYDMSYMLYGTLFMLGAAWTLQQEEHVRIDIVSGNLSPRTRAAVDVLGYLVFFFPAVGALVGYGASFALESWMILERSGQSMWQPPIYIFKTVLPLAGLLLLLQGLARFCRSLRLLWKGGGA